MTAQDMATPDGIERYLGCEQQTDREVQATKHALDRTLARKRLERQRQERDAVRNKSTEAEASRIFVWWGHH